MSLFLETLWGGDLVNHPAEDALSTVLLLVMELTLKVDGLTILN